MHLAYIHIDIEHGYSRCSTFAAILEGESRVKCGVEKRRGTNFRKKKW